MRGRFFLKFTLPFLTQKEKIIFVMRNETRELKFLYTQELKKS